MPRSGTTLVEQVLAAHPEVFGAGELTDVLKIARALLGDSSDAGAIARALRSLKPPDFGALAGRYLDRLDALDRSARHVVDKIPGNHLYLGVIAALWPGATIIACRRDPRDVAVSCWTTAFEQVHWANDLRTIARQIIRHDRLMAHWKVVLPIPIIEVVYEEMVADFEPQARRMVEALGLTWDPACLEFHATKRPVQTASLLQVRRPIYSSSVGRWRSYESALTPLFETFARHNHLIAGTAPIGSDRDASAASTGRSAVPQGCP
jgi:hypothetical protein